MSHVANIRHHQRALESELPPKRRKLNDKVNGSKPHANGVLNTKPIAATTKNAKQPAAEVESIAKRQPQSSEFSTRLAASESEEKSSSEDDTSEDEDDSDQQRQNAKEPPSKSSVFNKANDINGGTIDDSEEEQPSFGEMLHARGDLIEIQEPADNETHPTRHSKLAMANISRGQKISKTGPSLETILSQALKSNDNGLLESCLAEQKLDIIRSTVERLHSPLAATLLSRIAEKLHKSPGKASGLMLWVHWTLITHGGYLATQKHVVKQLQSLHIVMKQRAAALPSLLMLRGKLDLLDGQMQLRKNMRLANKEENEIHGPVIHVEGEKSVSDEDVETTNGHLPKASRASLGGESVSTHSDIDDLDLKMNTADSDSDNEDEDEDDDDVEDDEEGLDDDDRFIDDEAEESLDEEDENGVHDADMLDDSDSSESESVIKAQKHTSS